MVSNLDASTYRISGPLQLKILKNRIFISYIPALIYYNKEEMNIITKMYFIHMEATNKLIFIMKKTFFF